MCDKAHKQNTIQHFVTSIIKGGGQRAPMTREHLRIATEEWNNSPGGVPLNALCIDLSTSTSN